MLTLTITYESPAELSALKQEKTHECFMETAKNIIGHGGRVRLQKPKFFGKDKLFETFTSLEELEAMHFKLDEITENL